MFKWGRLFGFFCFLLCFLFLNVKNIFAAPVYDNPWQGVFQCHSTDSIGKDYIKGGGVIVRWDWLQPIDNNSIDQTYLNNLINLIRSSGKKQYLFFQIYGPTGNDKPNCSYNGPTRTGDNCYDQTTLPDWMGVYDTDPANDQISTLTDGIFGINPLAWDIRFQNKLRNFLVLLNQEFEQNSVIDKIEYMEPSIGPWNSTGLWMRDVNGQPNYQNLNIWSIAASCPQTVSPSTDFSCMGAVRTAGINKIMDIYHEVFIKTPMTLINESCRFESCNYGGVNYLLDTYGMKTFFKQAGLGSPTDGSCGRRDAFFSSLCGSSATMTRCAHETNGVSIDAGGTNFTGAGCSNYSTIYQSVLSLAKTSYYCMYSTDITYSGNQTTNVFVAQHAGAHISIISSSTNATVKNIGEQLIININWLNQGSTALIGPKIQGKKWTPSSYKLFLEFVNNGSVSAYREYYLNPGTNTWNTISLGGSFNTSTTINLPKVLGGAAPTSQTVYKIYFGLADPNGDKTRFGLINSEAVYDSQNKRYLLTDNFTVVGQAVPDCSSDKPSRSLGNANCDNKIDGIDFEIFRQEKFNIKNTKNGDFDDSGTVDGSDYQIWKENN